MSLIPWKPLKDLESFFEDWDWPERMLNISQEIKSPRMDIYEDKGNLIAEAELPGVDPKNIDIEIKNNILKIEAKAEEKSEKKEKGYYKKEITSGYYKRMVALPAEVIDKKASASYDKGVLKVVIPLAKPEKNLDSGTKVKVSSGK